jgi:DNA replication protein DnaC
MTFITENGFSKDPILDKVFAEFLNSFSEGSSKQNELRAIKQARWDALPEEEKQRILALREKERQEFARRNEERLREEEREEQLKEWRSRGLTPRFYNASWENWIADTPKKKHALETVKKAWEKNLLLVGKGGQGTGNGNGKTHLAMCLVKEGATYCLVPDLIRMVREDLAIEQEVINKYGKCKLLILDEIGRQKATDFEHNLLFEIMDKRWNNMLPTTIIGNIGKENFTALCGAGVSDRFKPEVVIFDWESRR